MAAAATGRVTRRRVRTRANLLDAAFAVFAAKGFGRVSIEEVCEAAGYSRGAFYSNFASLDELFFALYRQRADLIADQVSGALALDGPDRDVAAAVDRVTEVLLLDREWLLVKTDFLVHAARVPDVAGTLLAHRARLRRAIADRLARAPGLAAAPAPSATRTAPRTPWSPPTTASPPDSCWTGTSTAPGSGSSSSSPPC
ncbi:transcriptional regulator, TetR family [Streptomyces sp. SolWspMP-5a-2]|nr:transcriptional regulator, TetR family [Streptomyces sp. SolWspMP-5a-2]